MTKISRYHRNVFFPEWSDEALEEFLLSISAEGSLKFSLHAVQKIVEYSFDYGRNLLTFLLKIVKKDALDIGKVFEFYATDHKIKRACFRYSFSNFPVDLVLVISADGVVITVFVSNKNDAHSTLDESLYERSS